MKSVQENNFFSVSATLNVDGRLLDISKPQVMGILNVTSDSFYDGGRYTTEDQIISQTKKMLEDGAAFIDVGAYSSRPGATDIPVPEELERSTSAIKLIKREFPSAVISVDTFRTPVARAAIDAGAAIINDISAGELDPTLPEAVAAMNVPYIAMHMRGTPGTMTTLNQYDNIIKDIIDYFHLKLNRFRQLGIKDIIIDPGFGFSKNIEQNFTLLNGLDYFRILGRPVLAGLSRKSLIWKTLSQGPQDALNGTTTLNTIALMNGATILRVHDVKEAVEAVKLFTSMRELRI